MVNKKSTNTIIWIISIAMTGFIIAQFFWIRGAFVAAEDTFKQVTISALRSIVQYGNDIIYDDYVESIGNRIHNDPTISPDSIFCDKVLYSLVLSECSIYEMHKDYEYGILDNLTGKIVVSSAEKIKSNVIKESPFKKNLRSLLNTERYCLVIWFSHDKWLRLKGDKNNWLLLLSLLLFVIMILGHIISLYRLDLQKQTTLILRDFINNITHEFKTPLAAISMASEMIKQHKNEMPSEKIDKYITIIFDENKRLKDQIDRIMAASLIDEKRHILNLTELDINELIYSCADTIKILLRDNGGTIEVIGKSSSKIKGDKQHLTNVFNNLLENGIKYSAGDAPRLKIVITEVYDGIEIVFSDKGIGIANNQLNKIFDRLYRVPSGDLFRVSGTGLGLYYVKRVIDMHSGTIKVESKLGVGSRFTVFLPYNLNI